MELFTQMMMAADVGRKKHFGQEVHKAGEMKIAREGSIGGVTARYGLGIEFGSL